MNTEKIINTFYNSVDVKYDNIGDSHIVYVGIDNQVRRIIFPTRSMALQFMDSMGTYSKLKVS